MAVKNVTTDKIKISNDKKNQPNILVKFLFLLLLGIFVMKIYNLNTINDKKNSTQESNINFNFNFNFNSSENITELNRNITELNEKNLKLESIISKLLDENNELEKNVFSLKNENDELEFLYTKDQTESQYKQKLRISCLKRRDRFIRGELNDEEYKKFDKKCSGVIIDELLTSIFGVFSMFGMFITSIMSNILNIFNIFNKDLLIIAFMILLCCCFK